MFRRSKTDDPTTPKSKDAPAAITAPPLKPPSRRGAHVTDRAADSGVGVPPTRSGVDLSQRHPTRPRIGASEGNKLIVGRDIHLKGEIASCDKLVVEGYVEAGMMVARAIEVLPTGVFKGDAQVDEADISGRFEGTLVARERLTVRSRGRISGEIRYGTIVIESGGEISGAMQTLTTKEAAGDVAAPAASPPAKDQ